MMMMMIMMIIVLVVIIIIFIVIILTIIIIIIIIITTIIIIMTYYYYYYYSYFCDYYYYNYDSVSYDYDDDDDHYSSATNHGGSWQGAHLSSRAQAAEPNTLQPLWLLRGLHRQCIFHSRSLLVFAPSASTWDLYCKGPARPKHKNSNNPVVAASHYEVSARPFGQ